MFGGEGFWSAEGMGSGGLTGVAPFADPFFDMASMSMPRTIQNALRLCEYVWYASPMLAAAEERVSSYFLTDINVKGDKLSRDQREEIREYLHDEMRIMSQLKQANIDEMCYGNQFTSVILPFRRSLACPTRNCGLDFPLRVIAEQPTFKYRWNNFQFEATCPKCGYDGPWKRIDRRCGPEAAPIIKHWNIHYIDLLHDIYTGHNSYIWRIEEEYRRQIISGKIDMLEKCPWEVVDAVRTNSYIRLDDDFIHHGKELTLAGIRNRGWGISRTLRSFRQVYYVQVVHRYNEAIASDYVVPFRLLTPGARSGSSDASMDPLLSLNMSNFGARVEGMLRNHRRDPAGWNWLPFPVQYQALGGEANQLAPKDLLDQGIQTLLSSLNVPMEMFNLSLSMQNAPVNLRLFEQIWSHLPSNSNRLLQFIVDRITQHMGWEDAKVELTPVTLADDAQKQMSKLQLMSSGAVSKTTGLRVVGLDASHEMKQQLEEQMEQAELQQKMQEDMEQQGLQTQLAPSPITQMAQGQQQGAPQGQGQAQGDPSQQNPAAQQFAAANPTGSNIPNTPENVLSQAQTIASQLLSLPESQKDSQLIALKKQNPLLHSAVRAAIDDIRQQAQTQGGAQMLQQQKQSAFAPGVGALTTYRRYIARRAS